MGVGYPPGFLTWNPYSVLFSENVVTKVFMTYINVLGDGSTIPPLQPNQLLLMILNGNVHLGYFNRYNFCNHHFWIDEVEIQRELYTVIINWIVSENSEVLVKKHPVLLMCPEFIIQQSHINNLAREES